MLDQSKKPPQRPGVNRSATESSSTTSSSRNSYSRNSSLHACRIPQLNQHGNPLDAMSRSYAQPAESLDIEKALRQPAQPGTFRYQLERGPEIEKRVMTDEDKKAEFERVKNCLKGWGGKN